MDPYALTHQSWNQLAAAYQEKFMDLDLYDDTYNRFCQLIPQTGAAIFEIGCGPGNITRYLLRQRPDFQIKAIDFAPAMVELAAQNCPSARFEVMDARDIHTLAGPFDAIICGFCLPYLSREDAIQLIQQAARLLLPGGIFYLSAIEGDYAQSGLVQGSTGHSMYLFYHPTSFLAETLQLSGFGEVEIFRKETDPVQTVLIGKLEKG